MAFDILLLNSGTDSEQTKDVSADLACGYAVLPGVRRVYASEDVCGETQSAKILPLQSLSEEIRDEGAGSGVRWVAALDPFVRVAATALEHLERRIASLNQERKDRTVEKATGAKEKDPSLDVYVLLSRSSPGPNAWRWVGPHEWAVVDSKHRDALARPKGVVFDLALLSCLARDNTTTSIKTTSDPTTYSALFAATARSFLSNLIELLPVTVHYTDGLDVSEWVGVVPKEPKEPKEPEQPNGQTAEARFDPPKAALDRGLDCPLAYVGSSITYPPFKNGLYLEEHFLAEYRATLFERGRRPMRTFLPLLWTNFQIEPWFNAKRNELQASLDRYVSTQPPASGTASHGTKTEGYFAVVQHDDGPLLRLPPGTTVFGACTGDVPIPLIYEDRTRSLEIPPKPFGEKDLLCSFVGVATHHVRRVVRDRLVGRPGFHFSQREGWTPAVAKHHQNDFVETTRRSKFVLAPRGYGRQSFRFYEAMRLGSVPVYVWDDVEYLPYQDVLDWKSLAISINVRDVDRLPGILESIDESRYNEMLSSYRSVERYFTLQGMTEYVVDKVSVAA